MHAAAPGSWGADAPMNLHTYPQKDKSEGPRKTGTLYGSMPYGPIVMEPHFEGCKSNVTTAHPVAVLVERVQWKSHTRAALIRQSTMCIRIVHTIQYMACLT